MADIPALDTIVKLVEDVDRAFDLAAPFLGLEAYAKLADGLTALLEKVQTTAEAKGRIPADEVAAADVAVDAAEDARFPVGKS